MRLGRRVTIGRKLAAFVCVLLALLGVLAWGVLSGLDRVQSLDAKAATAAAALRTLERGRGALDAMHAAAALVALQQTPAQVAQTEAGLARLEKRADAALLGQVAQQTDPAAAASLRRAAAAIRADAAAIKTLAHARLALLDLRDRALLPALPRFAETVHETVSELEMGSMLPAAAAEEQARLTHYAGSVTDGAQAALRFVNTQDADDSQAATMGAAIAHALLSAAKKTALPETAQSNFVSMTRHGDAVMKLTAALVARTAGLQEMLRGSVRTADAAATRALGTVQDAFAARAQAARAQAGARAQRTRRNLLGLCLLILGLTIAAGVLLARTIARPMRAMTQALCRMAEGDTSAVIGHRRRRDEIGAMATALETLRGVVAHAFVEGQMIEQMPVGVMMADPRDEFRIVYINAAVREIMAPVESVLPVPVASLVGQGIDIFDLGTADQRDILADPARLPMRARIRLGRETMDLRISAIHDRDGSYRGPMIAWSRATGQVELAERFENSVASIVGSLGGSAETMRNTAAAMDGNAADSVRRAAAMAAAAGQASANVRAVEDNATALAASISEIAHQVSESARMASQAVTEAQATDTSVAGLNTAASRIGDVVQLIGDIAARTNLLALNATIEAARAGDAGRGFAVVASEVKTLASQTARATEEVASQIAAMQSETGRAVGALHAIGDSIKRLDEIAASIAAAVEEQGAATREIARAVQQASAGTAEVSGNIGAVSDAMQHTRAQSGAVLEAAGLLASQSGALKEGVDRFLAAMREAG